MKLDLFYPVKPQVINQKFGNITDYYKNNGVPIVGHNGIDFQAYHGQPVYATHDGVAYYETDDKGGHGFVIRTNEPFDYEGGQAYFKSIYWHLCDLDKEPQFAPPIAHNGLPVPVKAGQLIGYADSTGLSTGDHLHFGLKPQLKGEENGIWYNPAQNNGYLGAIDPAPYFNGYYAEDATKVFGILNSIKTLLSKAINLFKK